MPKCRSCGAEIEFIDGPNGRPIPAQKIRTVYRRVTANTEARLLKVEIFDTPTNEPVGDLWISHFETCPDASRFSRKR